MPDRQHRGGPTTDAAEHELAGEPESSLPDAPVRDLAPRRRWLYLAIVLAILGANVIVAATLIVSCAAGECSADSFVWLGVGFVGSAVLVVLALRQALRPSFTPEPDRLPDTPAAAGVTSDRFVDDPEHRLARFLDRLDRLPTDGVRLLAVRPLDEAGHAAARDLALEAARAGGRAALVDETTSRIAAWIGRAFGTRSFDPEMIALAWRHEPLRLEDRERLLATLSDAALAVATVDRVDEATYAELLGPCAMLADDGDAT